MSKLSELLNELKENKLNKTYNKVMTDIADIKSDIKIIDGTLDKQDRRIKKIERLTMQ